MSDTEQRGWLERLGDILSPEPKSRDELLEVLREANDRNLLDANALSMIEGVLQVSQMQVRDIMLPPNQMVVVDINAPIEDTLKLVIESSHSRFPVFGDNKDEILGVLLAKNLLPLALSKSEGLNLKDILHPAVFIPESKRLNVLLEDFRHTHSHMAIVVDEYGGVAGLVTIEDVLEQIVGDIEDESDTEEEDFIKHIGDNEYTIKALTEIEDFNEHFNEDYSDEDFDTIGGLVTHAFGHVPRRDEVIYLDNYCFKVLHADRRRVQLFAMTIEEPHHDESTSDEESQ